MSKQILKVGINERFHTISEALRCACKGDEIVIESGVYRENIKIDKDITITGLASEGRDRPLIVIGKNHHFDVCGKADIYNIEICQSETPKYYFPEPEYSYTKQLKEYCSDSVNFNNNQLIRLYDDCTFNFCIITDTLKNIVPVFSFSGSSSFYNCTFSHSKQFCICIDSDSFCRVSSCKFIDNFAGIKVKGYLQVEASDFQNTVFTNVYLTSNSKAIVYGSSFSNAYVNILVDGNGVEFGCYRSDISLGKVNNIHIRNSNKAYIEQCKVHDAKESGIYVEDKSLIKVEKSEIYDNKKGFVIDTSKNFSIKSSKITNNTEHGVYVCCSGLNPRIEDCDLSYNNIGLFIGYDVFDIDKETNNTDVGFGGYGYDPDESDFNDDCTESEVGEEVKPIIPYDLSEDFDKLERSFCIEGGDVLFCKILSCSFQYNNIGIKQELGSCCTYKKCNIEHNKESGINLGYSSNILIEDSVISSNESYGIYADGKSEVRVIRCTISNNKKDGTFNNEFKANFDLINCDNQDDSNPPSNYKLLHEITYDSLSNDEDLEAVFHLLREYISEADYFDEGKTDISEEELLDAFKKRIGFSGVVIKYQNKVVGYAGVSIRNYVRCTSLYNFVIDKDYRNKGIGTKFIEHIIYCNRHRVKKIIIDNVFLINNKRATEFFTKLGFTQDKDIVDFYCRIS